MNNLQQEIHKVSLAISKLNFLKMNNEKVSIEAINNVDTKQKKFQKLFRETKKSIIETNTPTKFVNIKDLKMFVKEVFNV